MTFLKSRSSATRVIGCPDVVASAPDGYTLPMRVDPNTTPAGAIWIPKVTVFNNFTPIGASTASTSVFVVMTTLVIPEMGVDGTVFAASNFYASIGASAGQWAFGMDDSTNETGEVRQQGAAGAYCSGSVSAAWAKAAGSGSITYRQIMASLSGNFAATATTDPRLNRMVVTFVPS